ncbi:MAG: OmpH family outer membrane protein [Chitinophagaceae bacterium]|nr:OmpH family outer membrane protein [Chitinophagaceae bacterium]
MKKLLFVCVVLAASFLTANTASAQTKIGYFDEESVLGAIPGIGKVDSLMQIFVNDSIGGEYNYRIGEYQRADSTFKKDSINLKGKALELAVRDLNQKRAILVNWQQYATQMRDAKLEQLLNPYRSRIAEALKQVVAENKYTLVINQSALSTLIQPPISDNLSIRVAMKMKLPLPKEIEDAFRAATGGGGTTAPKK